jgi:hypothetical protein
VMSWPEAILGIVLIVSFAAVFIVALLKDL